MPQLDPAVFLPQIFWLFILFGVVYLFIAHSAAPKITEVLERRQDRIASDLQEAEKLQAQAEDARAAYEKALDEARAKATLTVAAKREAIKADVEAEYNKLSASLNKDAAAAEAKIAAAKDKALDEVRIMAADVCKDIILSVSGLELDQKVISASVDSKFNVMKETANG
ncbi:MAG: F0F1 ATP synthase subunit B' [Alphaproteobacteria bacterium]|nr:MAG: F0F1 ATP synthase subunit B' [Alphaproteobacteria bacterium]